MSVIKQAFIYCDGGEECPDPDSPFDTEQGDETAYSQRQRFHFYGWKHVRGKDYCDLCAIRLGYAKAEGGES